MKDIFKLTILSLFLNMVCLALWLGSFIYKTHQPMGTVDMQTIINSASQTLAKSYPEGNVPKPIIESVAGHVKETIQAYGHEHKVMILAKGAILSGEIHDLTDEIFKTLQKVKK